jgi:Carboxypeptidase regulatory-like domain
VRPAILVLLWAAAVSAQPASVDGTVVNRATGQPLAGVHVRLFTGDFGSAGVDRAYGAISDRAGHFSVSGMQPGLYIVVLERAGFLQAQAAGPSPVATLALKAGQNVTGRKLEMNPRAMILGRVVDEYGDPMQGFAVETRPVPPDHAPAPVFFGLSNVATDDRGEFRILASPGRYYVLAFPDWLDQGVTAEVRADGSVAAVYAPTYYPSAAETGSAAVVQAGPGQDVAGIEIHLMRKASGHELTLSGQVTGAPEGAQVNVTLRYGESFDKLNSARSLGTSDGKFSFTGLQPGYYRAFARYSSSKTSLQNLPMDFRLDDADQTDMQLALRPGEELTGTLEIAGNSVAGASVEKRTVNLEPIGDYDSGEYEATTGEAGKSGAFRIANIHASRFRVVVEPLPANAFIQSVTLDGAEVPDSILDFSHGVGGSSLKVTISLNGAQISGKVLGHEGEPLSSPLAFLTVWRDDKQIEIDNSSRVTNGEYSIKALRPGKYRLAVVDVLEMEDYATGDGDDALKDLKSAAQEIEVKAGDRIVQDLKVIGKEDLRAKPKQ